MKTLNLFKFGGVIFAFLLALMSASPGTAGHPVQENVTGKLQETTDLEIWVQWSPLPPSVAQAYDAYETVHPEIALTFYTPVDLITELDAAFIAGTAPDIIVWEAEGNLGGMAMQGQLLDLRSLGITEASLAATFGELAASAVNWHYGLYGIPVSTTVIALVYNKATVSSEYFPAEPLNFVDLTNKAEEFFDDTGKYLICNQGMGIGSVDSYHVAPIFFGFGVPEYIDSAGTVYANTTEAIQAGTWIDNFHNLSNDINSYGECQNRLISGDVGMWWTGPWALSELSNQGVDYGIIPMGKPFNKVMVQMITSATIARGTANEALALIQTIANEENSIQFALVDKYVPANQAALMDPAVQAIPEIKAFGDAAQISVPFGNAPFHYCQWAPIGSAVERIWSGIQTPEVALNQAQNEIELCVQPILELMFPYHLHIPLITR